MKPKRINENASNSIQQELNQQSMMMVEDEGNAHEVDEVRG